jgi:hypothetical protein
MSTQIKTRYKNEILHIAKLEARRSSQPQILMQDVCTGNYCYLSIADWERLEGSDALRYIEIGWVYPDGQAELYPRPAQRKQRILDALKKAGAVCIIIIVSGCCTVKGALDDTAWCLEKLSNNIETESEVE